MKKKKNKFIADQNLFAWILIQTLIIIFVVFFSFLYVIFIVNHMHITLKYPHLQYAFGIGITMFTFLSGINYYLARCIGQHVSTLSNAIRKAANGNFDITLNINEATYFTKIFKDVYRDFNKMCAELKNVQVLRHDFIDHFSHEFKTPITSINGFASLLLEQDVTETEKKKYLRIIMEESASLADLANSTILLSKLDSQQIITDKNLYSLDEQLRRCVIMLSPTWNAKNIEFHFNLEHVKYNGNPEIMQHLWLNLLSNAIKFTAEHGLIKISLSEQQEKVIFQISDTGIGMTEEVASHIFEKYYQSPNTDDQNHGLGLGLAIVSRVTKLCNGSIKVDSKLGTGTIFTVILPNFI